MSTFIKALAALAMVHPDRAGSDAVNQDRRRLLVSIAMGIAAAGAAGQLPARPAAAAPGDAIRPFRVDVPEEDLVDLRRRIAATRWPDRETDPSQGIPLAKLRPLVEYWGTGYDWRRAEVGAAFRSLH
jgi:Epoxide hydrolase N terminus